MVRTHRRRRRTVAVLALGLAVSMVAAWILNQLADLTAVGAVLSRVQPLLLVGGVLSLGLSMAVRTARWRVILPHGPARPTVRQLLPFMIVGYAANAVAPLRAGDAARGVITARAFRLGMPETLGSVGLERLLDGLALGLLLLLASAGVVVPAWFSQASLIVAAAGIAILTGLLAFGLVVRSRGESGAGIGRRVWRGARSDNARIARSFGWSLGAWCIDGLTFWLCALALGLDISPVVALLIAGGAALGSVAPSAPAALGTFELAGTAVAIALGLPATDALAVVVLAHAATVVPIMVTAVLVAASAGLTAADVYRMSRVGQDVGGKAVSHGSLS